MSVACSPQAPVLSLGLQLGAVGGGVGMHTFLGAGALLEVFESQSVFVTFLLL